MNATERAALKRVLARQPCNGTLTSDVCEILLGIGQTVAIMLVLAWLASPVLA